MITKMTKYTFLLLSSDTEAFLRDIQDLGVLDSLLFVLFLGRFPVSEHIIYAQLSGDLLLNLFGLADRKSYLSAVFLCQHLIVKSRYRSDRIKLSGYCAGYELGLGFRCLE